MAIYKFLKTTGALCSICALGCVSLLVACAKPTVESTKQTTVVKSVVEIKEEGLVANPLDAHPGKVLYMKHCGRCHMSDGSGVPSFQPPLVNSPIVDGEIESLRIAILAGSSGLTQRPSPTGQNMPAFSNLSMGEINTITEYVKEAFGTKPE